MQSLSKKEAREFCDMIGRIGDERVRYFYMMLGDALADALASRLPPPGSANTGPDVVADLQKRINTN